MDTQKDDQEKVPGPHEIKKKLAELFAKSPFVRSLGIRIKETGCGHVAVAFTPDPKLHADWEGKIDHAVLAALCDSVLSLAGASTGEIVRVFSSNISYAFRPSFGSELSVTATVRHHGRATIMVEGELKSEKEGVAAAILATLENTGKIEGVPRKW